ncbi:hypothetical protein KRP22_007486 [Phytophthora ramorum]|nr:hypothetical protein KRP22_4503 [Phytophthora ramorum]
MAKRSLSKLGIVGRSGLTAASAGTSRPDAFGCGEDSRRRFLLWCVGAAAETTPAVSNRYGTCVNGVQVVRLRRRVVLDRIVVGLPYDDVHRVARDSYTYAALSLLWMLRLDGLPSPQTLISQDEDSRTSLEFMRTLLAEEEAPSHAIITTGHIGFWEILPTALARPALPIQTQWIVYRPLHDGSLDDLVASIRQAPDRRLIADKKCYGLLRDVLQRPNSDGNAAQLVGLVADQRCNSEHTRADVTFLGQPTRLATGAARLHAETGATLWFAAVLHNKRYYETSDSTEKPFRLVLRPISTANIDSKQDVTALVQTYASKLEKVVLENPAQYLWMHDLWNTKHRTTKLVEWERQGEANTPQ